MVVSQQMDANQDSDYFNFKNPDRKRRDSEEEQEADGADGKHERGVSFNSKALRVT